MSTKTKKTTKKTTNKTANKKPATKAKASSCTKSREDRRQEARIRRIEDEMEKLDAAMTTVHRMLTSDQGATTPMDRLILMTQFSAMETYFSALLLKRDWEQVRTRTSSGVHLNREEKHLKTFLFGFEDEKCEKKEYNKTAAASKKCKKAEKKCTKATPAKAETTTPEKKA